MAYRNYATDVGFIVGKDGNSDFATIATALTAAVSGDTIFIRPGTYTENPVLKAGVNLTAYTGDGYNGNVIILGKCTMTTAGTVDISGIQLKTNSDFALAVTGSVASIVNLYNCFVYASGNTSISFTSSSASAQVNLYNCIMDTSTTGITHFISSSTGVMIMNFCSLNNTGASTTPSTTSAGLVTMNNGLCAIPLATTLTGTFSLSYCYISTANITSLTTAGTGGSSITFNQFTSGSASAISAGAGTTIGIGPNVFSSSNTNVITGAGNINITGPIFSGTSHQVNTTTQSAGAAAFGLTQGTAPSAGAIGEQIRSNVLVASGVSMTTGTIVNITSISLTAGIWDISAVIAFNGTMTGATPTCQGAINLASLTTGNFGDAGITLPILPTSNSDVILSVPSYRVTLASTTPYYMNAVAVFTTGTMKGYGRLSATRVG